MLEKLRSAARSLKQELKVYQLLIADNRTPKPAKILLGAAVGYALLPFDIIPDFIPVIGHLDDLIIVPTLAIWGIKLIPQSLIEDIRRTVAIQEETPPERDLKI